MSKGDQEWFDAMKAKGHTPRMADWSDEPQIDMFVLDHDPHNGPGCETCHWFCCEHCESPKDIPECSNPCLELNATEIKGALPAPLSE